MPIIITVNLLLFRAYIYKCRLLYSHRLLISNISTTVLDKRLTDVLVCQTTSSYFYVFKQAEMRPHFVLDYESAKKYSQTIVTHDIGFQKKVNLCNPIKMLSDNSIEEGLRAGQKEEADFYFFSNKTTQFNHFFDEKKIMFDVDFWMKKFDDKQGNKIDQHGRGFVDGHVDLGFTREGATKNILKTQKEGIDTMSSIPILMGDKDDYKQLGTLPDNIMTITDKYVFENDKNLMWEGEREKQFAQVLRERIGKHCTKSRFEAFTLVRQLVLENNMTARHCDGPNDHRIGYRHTCVYSFLTKWKGVSRSKRKYRNGGNKQYC